MSRGLVVVDHTNDEGKARHWVDQGYDVADRQDLMKARYVEHR